MPEKITASPPFAWPKRGDVVEVVEWVDAAGTHWVAQPKVVRMLIVGVSKARVASPAEKE